MMTRFRDIKIPKPSDWITSRRIRQRQMEAAIEYEKQNDRLKKWLPFLGSWFKTTRVPEEDPPDQSFIACPKVTFLINPPKNLTCYICQETELNFQSSRALDSWDDAGYSDSIPVITPCGHVAGSRCMETWLEKQDTCPICREVLLYRECGHPVVPKRITMDEIHRIPATIPSGGFIPDLCYECYGFALWDAVDVQLQASKQRLLAAMARFDDHAGAEEASAMLQAKQDFEAVVPDEYYKRISIRPFIAW